MFRITQDPSSGSGKLYWTEITSSGSVVFVVMCVVGVWRYNLNLWCVCVCVCVCVYAAPPGATYIHIPQVQIITETMIYITECISCLIN
jgi:hypothetical protein